MKDNNKKKKNSRQEDRERKRRAKQKRSSTLRNGIIIAVAATALGTIIAYNYSVEQTMQMGLAFGTELEGIQDEIEEIQAKFYSEKTKWEEGDLDRERLLEFYDMHVERFELVIEKYDELDPPDSFEGAVSLLKLSSQAQLDSDSEYIKWIRDGDRIAMARSDALLQDALEYELLGLVEFYAAKTGTKTHDDTDEKFTEPQRDIAQRANEVADHMIRECDEMLDDNDNDNSTGSLVPNPEWSACVAEAEEWRSVHLP